MTNADDDSLTELRAEHAQLMEQLRVARSPGEKLFILERLSRIRDRVRALGKRRSSKKSKGKE